MTIYGTYDACAAQVGDRPHFDAAFAFLRQILSGTHEAAGRLAALKEGEAARIDLAGPDGTALYALMQYARTKPRAEQKAESHRSYADVQAVIDGDEILEVMALEGLETTLPYDASRDVALYTMPADGSRLIMRPGLCAVLFPEDGHAPLQAPDGISRPSRRVVVKVQLDG